MTGEIYGVKQLGKLVKYEVKSEHKISFGVPWDSKIGLDISLGSHWIDSIFLSNFNVVFRRFFVFFCIFFGTSHTGHVTHDAWHMPHETWHITHDTHMLVNNVEKFQVPSSYSLRVKVFWKYFNKWMTEWINEWQKVFKEPCLNSLININFKII